MQAPRETKYTFKVVKIDDFSMGVRENQMSSSEIVHALNLPRTSRILRNVLSFNPRSEFVKLQP